MTLTDRNIGFISLKSNLVFISIPAMVEKNKMVEYKEKAIKSAAAWNVNFNKERKDGRRCCFDLQSFTIHYPKARTRKMTKETDKVGNYPIALIPGQFTDFYKRYAANCTLILYFYY